MRMAACQAPSGTTWEKRALLLPPPSAVHPSPVTRQEGLVVAGNLSQ